MAQIDTPDQMHVPPRNALRLLALGTLYGVSVFVSVIFSPAIGLTHAPADHGRGAATGTLAQR